MGSKGPMTMKTKKTDSGRRLATGLAAIAAALCMGDAAAQQAVARLKQVTGNVLVSREAGLATGAEAQQLVNGTRIITTANSTAIVVFDNGCEVRLKENERFEIDSQKPCALMIAQALGPAQPVAAVGAPLLGLLLPAGAGVGLASDNRDTTPTPVSPN
jgi:hypothetical protein